LRTRGCPGYFHLLICPSLKQLLFIRARSCSKVPIYQKDAARPDRLKFSVHLTSSPERFSKQSNLRHCKVLFLERPVSSPLLINGRGSFATDFRFTFRIDGITGHTGAHWP